ncbi:MAG TPA: DUF4185 domain-containing protein [Pseudonocardia sp.]
MKPARKLGDLTGPGHTDVFEVGGTDLGATAVAPDGRLVSVFGDTFAGPTVGGPGWRAPVVLFADPASVRSGLRWTGSAGPGERAGQVVRYRHNGIRRWGRHLRRVTTVLPTDLITLGDEMFLHVMVCRELGNVRWTEVHRSRDNGVTWRPTGVRFRADHLGGYFQILTWERGDDGYVYVFSTGFQRDKGLVLLRVPQRRVLDVEAWEPWGLTTQGWGWGRGPTVVLPGRFGELSLRRVPTAGGGSSVEDRWVLVVFDDGNYRMDVLVLDSPVADLHTARRATVLQGVGWDAEDHAVGRVAQLYGGYILPGSTLAELHLVVSQWNTATNWPYRAMQFTVDVSGLRDPA